LENPLPLFNESYVGGIYPTPLPLVHLISKIASLSLLSGWKPDRAKMLASQLASKGYFTGEVAGIRLASRNGMSSGFLSMPPSPSREQVQTDWRNYHLI